MRTEAPPAASVSVTRLPADTEDLVEIEAIAAASFGEAQISVREELQRPWTRCWIAREGRRVVAFLIAWHVADELHVLHVATWPDARRRGLATTLMSASLEYAREHRARIVLLEVRRSNHAALRLYRKLGFTVMRVRRGYYGDNGEDAVEMVLALDPETGAIQPGRDELTIEI